MSNKVTEHDLADLVEGRLPAERVGIVRAAIERDPALRRTVVAMAADREALRRLSRLDQAAAVPDMVELAIAEAERRALIDQPGQQIAVKIGPNRKRQMVAAASLLVFIGLAAVASTLLATKGTRGLALLGSGAPKQSVSGTMGVADTEDDQPKRADAATASLPGDVPVPQSQIPATDAAAVQGPPSPSLAQLAEGWAQEAGRKIRDEAAESQGSPAAYQAPHSESAAADAAESGLSLDRAVALALEGRLKIVCEGADAEALMCRASDTPGVIALQSPPPAPSRARSSVAATDEPSSEAPRSPPVTSSWEGLRVEVRAQVDPTLAALRDRLASLRSSVSTPGKPSAQFAEVESPGAGPGGYAPSRQVEDVLWWALPPSAWKARASVIVTIEIKESGPR